MNNISLDKLKKLTSASIVLVNSVNSEVEQYLLENKGYLIKNLQSPDNLKINEVREIIGDVPNYELGKVGNRIHKMVAPSRLNLRDVAVRLCFCLDYLKEIGKTETTINNMYFRFLCWLHFEFLEISKGNITGNITYMGSLNTYVVMMLYIISGTGVNITIISSDKVDKKLLERFDISILKEEDTNSISSDYSLDNIVLIPKSKYKLGINVWLKGDSINEILTPYNGRGAENIINSAFINQVGVLDISTHLQQLYSLYSDCKGTIVEFTNLEPNEINALRSRYKSDNLSEYVMNICKELHLEVNLYNLLVSEFIKYELDEKSILYMFNNLRKYKGSNKLFYLHNEGMTDIQLYILYLLSCIGNDVVIISPTGASLKSKNNSLYEITYPYSIKIDKFPTSRSDLVVTTVARNAESELDTLLYDGSAGIFRDNQFKDANTVYLKPMNEEIDILWDKDINLRQGFQVQNGVVSIPVIFAEISGVKEDDTVKWCNRLNTLLRSANVFYNNGEVLALGGSKFIHSAEIIRNRKIDFELLSSHSNYPYSFLSNEKQLYMVSRLQEFLDSGIIKGVYTKGMENKLIEAYLSLSQNDSLIRMIQNFDFTKVNPKVVYVWMNKQKVPREDIITLHYLSMLGFDVLIFVPTGYNVLDEFICNKVFTTYINGNGLEPFDITLSNKKKSLFSKVFRR